MTSQTRRRLRRLAFAACGLGYAFIIFWSLRVPRPSASVVEPEFHINLMPRESEFYPAEDVPPEPERFDLVDIPLVEVPPLQHDPGVEPSPPDPRVPTDPPRVPYVIPEFPRTPFRIPDDGSTADVMPRAAPPILPEWARRSPHMAWASPDEELWVIARSTAAAAETQSPSSPEIIARVPPEGGELPVTLKSTSVFAGISGYIATVTVEQQFRNPYDVPIEAVYRFTLPNRAAVNEFIMTIGRRRIRGVIRERMEAERIFKEARRQGLRTALLRQDSPNVFAHRVANVQPREAIDVRIAYIHTLAYRDGWYELVYPLAVRPRPSQGSGDAEMAVPEQRPGHDIQLEVAIDAGLPIEEIVSPSHAIRRYPRRSPHQTKIWLKRDYQIPNRDFVLRYRVAGKQTRATMLTHRGKLGSFFTLMLHPPAELDALPRRPLEVIFAVDCSGSMQGAPFEKAKQAVERALAKLGPADTFQIIGFADEAHPLADTPIAATPANVTRGLTHVRALACGRSTELDAAIAAACQTPHEATHLRFVVLLTDGLVANERGVLLAVHRRLGPARLVAVGLGQAPNRSLLDRAALLGRGAVAYIGPDDDAGAPMEHFVERASRPALTDIAIEWGDFEVAEVYPKRVPDLFFGRPVVLTGRFKGKSATTVRIRGKVDGQLREFTLRVDPNDRVPDHKGIAPIWAMAKIADLARQMGDGGSPDHLVAITRIALRHGLVTPLTDIILIDALTRQRSRRSPGLMPPGFVPQSIRYVPVRH